MRVFNDRSDAGKQLAEMLVAYKSNPETVVVALPRGGVAVGFEIAKKLNLPLDILASRKIGMPGNPEFAVGAVTFDGHLDLNEAILRKCGISVKDLQKTIQSEKEEAIRRMLVYRQGLKALDFTAKTVILVDDGVATGSTVIAAIKSLRSMHVRQIVLAVPVLPAQVLSVLIGLCEKVVYVQAPQYFEAIGVFYKDFPQLSDEKVVYFIKNAK